MKFLDYFFLKIYHLLIFLKKKKYAAKWSALLLTELYVSFSVLILFSIIGLIYDNSISDLINQKTYFLMIFIICMFLIHLRYYKYVSVDNVEASYYAIGKNKRKLIIFFICLTILAIPILLFVFYRLYAFGHVSW